MARYLLTIADKHAAELESLFGSGLVIVGWAPDPAWRDSICREPHAVNVAGLDAITDEEYAPIHHRLVSGGSPHYHAGGPGRRSVMPPEDYTCTPECKNTHAEDQAYDYPVTEASDAQVQAAYTRWLLARADKYSPPDRFDCFLAGYRLAEGVR